MAHTILVPYDGGAQADDVLPLACATVAGSQGRVVALCVTRLPSWSRDPLPAAGDAAERAVMARALWATRCYDGVLATRLVRTRRVADAIVREAVALHADAIFLALTAGRPWQRGRRAWVAWEVVRRAPCRVLLTYPPALRTG